MRRRPSTSQHRRAAPPGRVRIVAGKWRGRRLDVADVPELRPTSERIRETLFNWIAPRIEGSRCLDLFAGSGVLGLEALSRGAAAVQFVERDPRAVRFLRDSVDNLGAEHAVVHGVDALRFLQAAEPAAHDFVFLDPPYSFDNLEALCGLLEGRGWLAQGASVYVEQDARKAAATLPPGWTVRREKKAGNVRYLLADVAAAP
ncbi:MAG: 16S rRNA (guanine(966)-N(2))-methyltransferase RsmD [Woeseia sp.]